MEMIIKKSFLALMIKLSLNGILRYNNYYFNHFLIKFIISKLFGIRYILIINDYCMLIADIDNNMNILVLDETKNNLTWVYAGYEGEVISVIKLFIFKKIFNFIRLMHKINTNKRNDKNFNKIH